MVPHTIRPENARDAGRPSDVAAILRAHLARESSRTLRLFFIHVLATLGGVMAFDLEFPNVFPGALRWAVPTLWLVCSAFAAAAAVIEREWQRRESELASGSAGDPPDDLDVHDPTDDPGTTTTIAP